MTFTHMIDSYGYKRNFSLRESLINSIKDIVILEEDPVTLQTSQSFIEESHEDFHASICLP